MTSATVTAATPREGDEEVKSACSCFSCCVLLCCVIHRHTNTPLVFPSSRQSLKTDCAISPTQRKFMDFLLRSAFAAFGTVALYLLALALYWKIPVGSARSWGSFHYCICSSNVARAFSSLYALHFLWSTRKIKKTSQNPHVHAMLTVMTQLKSASSMSHPARTLLLGADAPTHPNLSSHHPSSSPRTVPYPSSASSWRLMSVHPRTSDSSPWLL